MGAWGPGSFENDDAADWAGDLADSDDDARVERALDAVIAARAHALESSACSEALAAVEVVAALLGRASPDLPESLTDWIAGRPKPSPSVVRKAQSAVERVATESELKDLWEESGGEDLEAWRAAVLALGARIAAR